LRIGILTFHDGINYGAFAQVYSLQRFLESEGHEVKILNYKNFKYWFREYKGFLFTKRISNLDNNINKIKKFKKCHKLLNLTKFTFKSEKLSRIELDLVVIGSDEVWNFSSSFIGFDKTYFRPLRDDIKTISYAASFGSSNPENIIPEDVTYNLKRLNSISVRDTNSQNMISFILNKNVPIVLDPVFLSNLQNEAINNKKSGYIAFYSIDLPESIILQIKEFAIKVNKQIIAIGYKATWADINIIKLDPFEWMGYLKNADYVITSMFHGTIFSIKLNKEFSTLSTAYRKNKLNPMMSNFHLEDRLLNMEGNLTEMLLRNYNQKINYKDVNDLVDYYLLQSKDYLRAAINLRNKI